MPRVQSSGDSQYEYDSQWDGESDSDSLTYDNDNETLESSINELTPKNGRRYSVSTSGGDDKDAYLHAVDRAMGTLQTLHSAQSSEWKRALKHKSGVVVYVSKEKQYAGPGKKGGSEGYYAPVFKGELEIKGHTPAAVFGVVGMRKVWDEWYKEGNLVENLSDTASLTYMCMKGIAGSTTRDLSLAEMVSGSPTGTILFVSTSVVTPKVPRVAGRVRASIALNGWVLEPTSTGTKVTYYLHVNVKTFIPAFAAAKYLARRPTCIARIEEYLRSHGSPPMAIVEPGQTNGGGAIVQQPSQRRRRDSTASKRSGRSSRSDASGLAGLPLHVVPNEEAASYAELQKAHKLFKAILAIGQNEWSLAQDQKQNPIWTKQREGGLLPIVKGEALVSGATTEQVLGTILSGGARKLWDRRFLGISTVELDNGFDQGVYVDAHKGIFPHLGPRHYIIARGVEREDPTTDNGQIILVSRSTRANGTAPRDSTKAQMDISGWLIEDHNDQSVKVTHIAQLDVKETLREPMPKLLASAIAAAPHDVAEFVDDFGYAPFFVRWGEGPAQLESDQEGDLKQGRAIFRISGEGSGTMANGQQKCWLQWSEKMYERGVNLQIRPQDCATVSKVDGLERTVEFVWNTNVKEGATITLSMADGDGAEDLYIDGQFLDKTVGMDRSAAANGTGAGMKKKVKKSLPVEDVVAPAVVAAAASSALSARRQSSTAPETVEKPLTNGIIASPFVPVSRSVIAPVQVATPAVVDQQQQQLKSPIPADACLIISDDLYFTRSQCSFMAAVVFAAFLWGKLF